MSFCWGIDIAVAHLEFAFADMDSDHVEAEGLITKCEWREGERLASVHRQVMIYTRQIAGVYPPYAVFVEQPSGRFPKPQLSYVCGVVQAAVFEALSVPQRRSRERIGTPVWTITSGSWKKWTVGAGNATKEQAAAWATAQRYKFEGQDQCDAVCCAAAGRMIVAAGQWEAAA